MNELNPAAPKPQEPTKPPAAEKPEPKEAPEKMAVEDLLQETGTDQAVHVGMCVDRDWPPGTTVTRRQYTLAIERWLKEPMDHGQ